MIPAISDIGGVLTLVVDGEPFVILGAQCDIWRSTRQDEKVVEFIDAYREMNATAISLGIPWAKMEPERDLYDFSFLDWFIERTEAARLKLVVNLFNSNGLREVRGANGRGAVSPVHRRITSRTIPRDSRASFTTWTSSTTRAVLRCARTIPRPLDREARYLRRVAMHLKETDRNRTVIMVQLNNEYFYQQWADCKDNTQKHVRCVCEVLYGEVRCGKIPHGRRVHVHQLRGVQQDAHGHLQGGVSTAHLCQQPVVGAVYHRHIPAGVPESRFRGDRRRIQRGRAESADGRPAWEESPIRRGVADGGALHKALPAHAALLHGAEDERPGKPAVGSAGSEYSRER